MKTTIHFTLPSIILLCILFIGCQPTSTNGEKDFVSIFDGKTLNGWEGDSIHWSVKEGNIVGEVTAATPLTTNTFLVYAGAQPADFELRAEFKITEAGNSGIQYRSEAVMDIPHALRGYQADIDGRINYTGQNYEERGRTTLAYRGEQVTVRTQDHPDSIGSFQATLKNNAWKKREVTASLGSSDSLKTLIKKEDWNSCRIVARGNRLQHFINDILMSDVSDLDSLNRKSSGLLGFQAHVGPPMRVEYRNVRIKYFQ